VPTMFGALLLTTLPAATHELPQRQLPPECIDPETGEIRLSLRDDPLCVLQQDGATGSLGVAPSSAPVDQGPLDQGPGPTPADNPGNEKEVGQAGEEPGPNSEGSFGPDPTGSVGRSDSGDSQDSSAGGQGQGQGQSGG